MAHHHTHRAAYNNANNYNNRYRETEDLSSRSPSMVLYFWCTFLCIAAAIIAIPIIATEVITKGKGTMDGKYWYPK